MSNSQPRLEEPPIIQTESKPPAISEAPVPSIPDSSAPKLPEPESPGPNLPVTGGSPEVKDITQEQPEILPIPEYILGKGQIEAEILSGFLISSHPELNDFAIEIAKLYVEEAAVEGVNHDAAFAQMCLETGFLRYGGLVLKEMNNFCGLGAIGPMQRGVWFPDPRTGVRAHIQHLKAYATDEPLKQELVDPRYSLVRLGSSPKISGLAGTWAVDLQYGVKINSILERLYYYSFQKNT